MSDDPVRLDLSEDATADARDAMKVARLDRPSAARLATIHAAVIARLGQPSGGGGGNGSGPSTPEVPSATPASTTGPGGALAKALRVALAGGAAVGAIMLAMQPRPTVATRSETGTTENVMVAPSVSATARDVPVVAVSDLPTAASAPSIAAPAISVRGAATIDPLAAERAEVALLDAAQKALLSNPAETLRRVDEHARAFPNGTLVQEREVLAIEALLAHGQRAEAEARAARFRRAYPRSGHLRRVDVLLGTNSE